MLMCRVHNMSLRTAWCSHPYYPFPTTLSYKSTRPPSSYRCNLVTDAEGQITLIVRLHRRSRIASTLVYSCITVRFSFPCFLCTTSSDRAYFPPARAWWEPTRIAKALISVQAYTSSAWLG
jgi:hypothetical protein